MPLSNPYPQRTDLPSPNEPAFGDQALAAVSEILALARGPYVQGAVVTGDYGLGADTLNTLNDLDRTNLKNNSFHRVNLSTNGTRPRESFRQGILHFMRQSSDEGLVQIVYETEGSFRTFRRVHPVGGGGWAPWGTTSWASALTNTGYVVAIGQELLMITHELRGLADGEVDWAFPRRFARPPRCFATPALGTSERGFVRHVVAGQATVNSCWFRIVDPALTGSGLRFNVVAIGEAAP